MTILRQPYIKQAKQYNTVGNKAKFDIKLIKRQKAKVKNGRKTKRSIKHCSNNTCTISRHIQRFNRHNTHNARQWCCRMLARAKTIVDNVIIIENTQDNAVGRFRIQTGNADVAQCPISALETYPPFRRRRCCRIHVAAKTIVDKDLGPIVTTMILQRKLSISVYQFSQAGPIHQF